jgi:C4-dicarboxylate-binding protein DctP
VAQDTFQALGAVPVPLSLDDVATATKKGEINASESTFARYFPLRQSEHSKVVNDTEHSLFLTTILVNETFWKALPADVQAQMHQVAIDAARLERKHSIEEVAKTKEECKEAGIEVVEWNQTEMGRFKKAMEPLYKKYSNYFSKDMIASIQKQ